MSILFINGSPNKNGNTAALAAELLKDHEYETLNLTDYTIGAYGQNLPGDGLDAVIGAMKQADIVVIGSPLLAVGKGKYTPIRVLQTALVGIIFLSMFGSMISGVVLSRYVFAFFPKHGGYELAQQVHILCAYWCFICMSLHLGFHWSMMLAMARKHLPSSPPRTWSLRLIGWLWAAYGAFAFRRRGVSLYLLLRSHFVFYDYSEPVILFLIDHLSVMVMFVLIGYYFASD